MDGDSRGKFLWVISVAAAIGLLVTSSTSAAQPKRVLVVNSFGSAAPPFSVHAAAFESALVEKMGERVDLDEISLDMARYADPDMQTAIAEYLEKRHATWKPDLVVPIGSPAGRFVAQYRDRLFADTPILYNSLDRRLLPEGALNNNAAYIGQIFEVPGLLEDMLQIAPGTKNIYVVLGASPLEKQWKEVFRKSADPLSDQIKFTYFDDLSFDQMLERVKQLPPDSFIFVVLLLRDAAGVTHNADEALKQLHAVSNAPINSIFDHQLGLGLVGGRLYQTTAIGKESAEMAVRILHGEPASSLPQRLIAPSPPHYDWRELQRWNISEKLLPPGSTVLYRAPTAWQQYRSWIIAGLSIFFLQGLLIAALLANLVRRRRAERSLAESEKRFRIAADVAPVMIWMTGPDKLCNFLNKGWFEFTGRTAGDEFGYGWAEGVHPDDIDHLLSVYEKAFEEREAFSVEFRLRRHDGEYRWILGVGTARFEAGVFLGYIGSALDITERRQAELEHHVQTTELARVGRMALMGELAASLAHEVNNPLGAMVANASAGQRMLGRNALGEEELRELLADIVADGHRAREVIEGIRNMVRKSEISYSPLRPNEIIRDLIRIVRADALARKVNLATKIDENAGQVMGNRVQLLQVLLNLTMNAFDALSVIRPEARRVVIQVEPLGDAQICMTVLDSGPGFPDGIVDRLFEPFFSTKTEGTGMGLAIARSIIEAHGGTLSGKNAVSGGALFTICLPTVTRDTPPEPVPANASADFARSDL
jgi:PAS domain S-box-containing protein